MTRRHFLGGVVAASTITACSNQAGGEPGDHGEQAPLKPGEYREAPALADRVTAGDLPPVAQRLPKEPYVVQPGVLVDDKPVGLQPGGYGGILELAQESPSGDPVIFIGLNEPLLWAPSGFDYSAEPGIHGNVVAGWEVNDDDSVYTFHLREGLKWSDGEPVTIEDVRFAFEDVLYNEEITPIFPDYLKPGKIADAPPAELTVIDDWTFSIGFDRPYGTFPAQLAIAGWRGYGDILKLRHYLEQFHKKYASAKALAELVKEASLPEDEWFNLFNSKQLTAWLWNATTEDGVGHPTLMAWVLTSIDNEVFTYERNPYYFKIDNAGNQLPYIDGIRSQVVQSKETLTSRALFGEFDYLGERSTFRSMALIAEKAEQGEVQMLAPKQHVDPTTIFLNLTHQDPVWREVVRDVRFRTALSLALNRKELIETFYLGEFAEAPSESNPGDYDPEAANQLLDDMGLDQRDRDGWRLGPDGKRFRIPFEVVDHSDNHIPLTEVVAEHWNAVGVYTTVRQIADTVSGERRGANQIKADVLWSVHPLWRYAAWDDYLPQTNWGPLWQLWYISRGEEGEEPPAEVKELFELHNQFQAARLGTPESERALEGILASHRDNVWMISPFENAFWPTFFTTRVKNVATGIKVDTFGIIVTYSMEQWYLEE